MDSPKNDTGSEEYIQFAHDHFFGESMLHLEIGQGIANIVLSSSIKRFINWDTLEIAKGDWIDRRLKEHRSDILYRARLLKSGLLVNLLFEHKSKPDKKTH